MKLELEAGIATPAPPVGKDLGPHGLNLAEFHLQYNDATRDQNGALIPAVVTTYGDYRSFSLVTRTPTAAYLLRRAAGVEKGSGSPGRDGVGLVTREQLKQIALINPGDRRK